MNPFYEKKERKLQIGISNGLTFPEHLHDQVELLYVLEGQVEVTIRGEQQIMGKGDCAVIFPDQVHSYRSFCDNLSLLPIFDTSMTGPFLHSLQKLRPLCPFLTADLLPADVGLAFNRLSTLDIQRDLVLGAAWIQVILACILPLLELTEAGGPETEDLTYRLVHYIMEHFQEPLSLDILARELHVNKYYLSHIFTNRLQMNFPQYLNRIRLDYAMTAIRSSAKTLTQIWAEAGFSSQRSFNRAFQTFMGMTPLEYRKS